MITYFKMKLAEWKVKLALYGTISGIIDNHKYIITMIQALFAELKDVPTEQLKSEFVNKIAEIVHAQAEMERDESDIQD